MFHAIAAHIDFSHMELRHTVVSFLKDNLESFEAFFTDDEDVAAYLEALSKHGTWGDNLVFSVCAELLQSPIHIAQAHGVQIITPDQVLNAPIWVAYDGSSHYDSVFLLVLLRRFCFHKVALQRTAQVQNRTSPL
jgi:hypothetical protein